MASTFGTREWFEEQFQGSSQSGEDNWGHQWRASVKYKYLFLLKILSEVGYLKQAQPQHILDIGCGLGDLSFLVYQQNQANKVLGIDISMNAMTAAKKKYPALDFQVAELPAMSNLSGQFNGIICVATLYYLKPEERLPALLRIRDILFDGGWFLFSIPLAYMTESETTELIKKTGLKIKNINYNYSEFSNKFERPFLKFRRFPAIFKIIRWSRILEIYWFNVFLNWLGEKSHKKSNVIILAEK